MSGRGGPRALAPRLLALAAVVTALVAGTGVVQATPRATTTPDVVPVRLTSMTPVAGPNGASLVVTGTVTNTDAVAVTCQQGRPKRSSSSLPTTAASGDGIMVVKPFAPSRCSACARRCARSSGNSGVSQGTVSR